MKKFKNALGIGSSKRANKHILFPLDSNSAMESQSNQDSNAMSIDQASQESGEATIRVLTSDGQIILVDDHERQAFWILKDQWFHHTRAYDHDFLNHTWIVIEPSNL